jgi:YHS domain-containing protein
MTTRIRSILIALLFTSPIAGAAEPEIYSSFLSGAINGYDPVSYFTEGKPVKGKSAHTFDYKGATWKFSSAENRQTFIDSPEKYAPQYGGYCSYAVANGYTASTDPDAWTIYNGKLYLNYSISVRAEWSRDIPGNIKKADANWPSVLE